MGEFQKADERSATESAKDAPETMSVLLWRNIIAGVAATVAIMWLPFSLIYQAWGSALSLLIAGALFALVTSPGKTWRRKRLPVPGLLITIAAFGLLIFGINNQIDQAAEAAFAQSGEERLVEIREALRAGDAATAEALIAPIRSVQDPRVQAQKAALSALETADGNVEAAGLLLFENEDQLGPIEIAAIEELGPSLQSRLPDVIAERDATAVEAAAEAAEAAAKAAEEEAIQALFSGWDGSHRGLVDFVKGRMHDPGSFKHVETRAMTTPDNTILVTMTYRGSNAFGGVVTNQVVGEIDKQGRLLDVVAVQ
jgi:hypothetical protein